MVFFLYFLPASLQRSDLYNTCFVHALPRSFPSTNITAQKAKAETKKVSDLCCQSWSSPSLLGTALATDISPPL